MSEHSSRPGPGAAFTTLAGRGAAETRVRGSTFQAVAAPAQTEDGARALVAEQERAHHAASHHCSAWRLRSGVWRANDAGEPSGSAGAPILAAVDGAELLDCAVVVTRYYGGTKLGVGGLIRAYGECAALALAAAPRRRGIPSLRVRVGYPYEHTAPLMRALERLGAAEIEHGYGEGGRAGEVRFSLPAHEAEALAEMLREETSGTLAPEVLARGVMYGPATGGGDRGRA